MVYLMRSTIIVVLALILGLSSASMTDCQTAADWIEQRTGVYIGELVEVDSWDNHHEVECGGLLRPYPDHYDGDSLDVFECDREAFDAICEIWDQWRPLPLSENLSRIVYGDYTDSEPPIPEIESGYYLFVDRHDEAENANDDGALFDRASIDMSLFLYDVDNEMLYYYEYDT